MLLEELHIFFCFVLLNKLIRPQHENAKKNWKSDVL